MQINWQVSIWYNFLLKDILFTEYTLVQVKVWKGPKIISSIRKIIYEFIAYCY